MTESATTQLIEIINMMNLIEPKTQTNIFKGEKYARSY